MSLFVATIATPGIWLDVHFPRFLRYLRKHNPTARVGLMVPGTEDVLTHPAVQACDKVVRYEPEVACRPWFNSVRMEACEEFQEPEVLYIDCDCDVMGPLGDIGEQSDKDCLWVRSTGVNPPIIPVCQELGYGVPDWCANNGFLFLRKSFRAEYGMAYNQCWKASKSSRVGGLIAFNILLRMFPDLHAEIPYEWSTIWSDHDNWLGEGGWKPRTLQFCNDQGQAKRLHLENVWRAAQ